MSGTAYFQRMDDGGDGALRFIVEKFCAVGRIHNEHIGIFGAVFKINIPIFIGILAV